MKSYIVAFSVDEPGAKKTNIRKKTNESATGGTEDGLPVEWELN